MSINESFLEACEEGDLEGVKQTLKDGADVFSSNAYGWNGFYCAVAGEQLEMAQWLLAQGVDPLQRTSRGGTAFQMAVQHGDLDFVDQLFDAGALVNLQDDDGRFALAEQVSMNDDAELTGYLLRHGADVNMQDKDGWTALMYVVDREDCWRDILALLIAAGANLNHQSRDGWTPLLRACKNPHSNDSVFDLLLEAPELDVNLAGLQFGWTPLMAAVTTNDASVAEERVKKVLARGGDRNAAMAISVGEKYRPQHDILARNSYDSIAVDDSHNGFTAARWAAKLGRDRNVELLGNPAALPS